MKKVIICVLIFLHISALYAQNSVIVSKKDFKVIVLSSKSDTLCCYDCAVGVNLGDKQYEGDKRTPEGKFFISYFQYLLKRRSWLLIVCKSIILDNI